MNLPFYIAKRYLFSKKSTNVINIISGVSMFGIGIGALALIVVLSAFNGLEELVGGLYSSFDPEMKITVNEGKTFELTAEQAKKIKELPDVEFYVETLEETVLLKAKEKQAIATLKGVSADFVKMSGVDSMLVEGSMTLNSNYGSHLVMGYGIAYNLNLFITNTPEPVTIYAPKRTGKVSYNPEQAFERKTIIPTGIFGISPDFDYKYALVPLDFAREILEYNNEVSAIELGIKDDADHEYVKNQIKAIVGEAYTVKTRYELNELIYKTNRTEKWITFLILSFILVIATFNVIGSLTMLILDKKKDRAILESMGASLGLIRRIFLIEGILISFVGGVIGITIGGILSWIQMKYGLLKLSGTIVEYYPMKLIPSDFALVFATVMVIGTIATILPVRLVVKQ